jgi:hypothetical protein
MESILPLNEDGEVDDDLRFQGLTQVETGILRTNIAEKAVIAAVKTIAELARANDLLAYSKHPRISHRFGEKHSIKISFAMHLGNAIEGAVGSEQKVDALFLSKDSQIVGRIDELCDTYDRPILLTSAIYNIMTEKSQEFCRRLDVILMKETGVE